jgi:hypothetical protein
MSYSQASTLASTSLADFRQLMVELGNTDLDIRYKTISEWWEAFDASGTGKLSTPSNATGKIALFDLADTGPTKLLSTNLDFAGYPENENSISLVDRTNKLLSQSTAKCLLLLQTYSYVTKTRQNAYGPGICGLNMEFLTSMMHQLKIPPLFLMPHFKRVRSVSQVDTHMWDWAAIHQFPSQRTSLQLNSPFFGDQRSVITAHIFKDSNRPDHSIGKVSFLKCMAVHTRMRLTF